MSYPLDWKLFGLTFRAITKHYEGLDHIEINKPYIFAANHIGLIDAPFIASVLMKKLNHRIHFFAKEELIKQYGKFITKKILRFIPVYWSDPSKSIEEATLWLKKGESVAIFPEGRRSTAPHLVRGKTGVARLALSSRVPVVPIGYQGPIPSKMNESLLGDMADLFKVHAPVTVKVGKPMFFPEYYNQPISKELLQRMTDEIMEKISPLCNKKYKPEA
jgi:1-acyl-sn-glycerol-3-phosphate acyltransferase